MMVTRTASASARRARVRLGRADHLGREADLIATRAQVGHAVERAFHLRGADLGAVEMAVDAPRRAGGLDQRREAARALRGRDRRVVEQADAQAARTSGGLVELVERGDREL